MLLTSIDANNLHCFFVVTRYLEDVFLRFKENDLIFSVKRSNKSIAMLCTYIMLGSGGHMVHVTVWAKRHQAVCLTRWLQFTNGAKNTSAFFFLVNNEAAVTVTQHAKQTLMPTVIRVYMNRTARRHSQFVLSSGQRSAQCWTTREHSEENTELCKRARACTAPQHVQECARTFLWEVGKWAWLWLV